MVYRTCDEYDRCWTIFYFRTANQRFNYGFSGCRAGKHQYGLSIFVGCDGLCFFRTVRVCNVKHDILVYNQLTAFRLYSRNQHILIHTVGYGIVFRYFKYRSNMIDRNVRTCIARIIRVGRVFIVNRRPRRGSRVVLVSLHECYVTNDVYSRQVFIHSNRETHRNSSVYRNIDTLPGNHTACFRTTAGDRRRYQGRVIGDFIGDDEVGHRNRSGISYVDGVLDSFAATHSGQRRILVYFKTFPGNKFRIYTLWHHMIKHQIRCYTHGEQPT